MTTTTTTSSASASTLLSTLIPVGLFALVYLAIFLFLRRKYPRNYQPRSFLGSLRPHERSPHLGNSLYGWAKGFYQIPDSYVLTHHSLDGFLLLRLLKQSVVACLVGMLITWPVLFPVNATGGGGLTQFDAITIGNITNSYYRYFAHAGCAYLFFGYILFMITRESIYYINLRQAYLLSPSYASRLSSRTVLFTSVPEDYCNDEQLRAALGPNAVRRIWLATDTKQLDDLVSRRDKAAIKLEGAETKLIRNAVGARIKAEKKDKKGNTNGTDGTNGTTNGHHNLENGNTGEASKWLAVKKRPTHRLKFLIGKKVDTIDWCRAELQKLVPEVHRSQTAHRTANATKVCSVFVEFTTLAEAQAAYQSLTHHQVLHMSPRFTGMTPGEINWGNLRIKWWERIIRQLVVTTFITVLVIFWCIPVAFVGSISNVQALAESGNSGLSWLKFILDIPSVILGLVTGLLPSILLAVLMALLPIILRKCAKISGSPTLSAVELKTQTYYFWFQIINVFLVATIGSAASSVIGDAVEEPSDIPTLLAEKIPLASDFYLSYFVLQGLAVVASMLLAASGLVMFLVLGKFLDKTPRKLYKRWVSLSGVGWGTVFPIYTTLFIIAICYSCIAPFVLLFATIGLYLFYTAYRYNLLFVTNAVIDTKGRVYAQALHQIFVGLYFAEGCLIGLFAIGCSDSVGAIGPLILMIIFLIFTILYQSALKSALQPLMDYLPKSLEAEERRLLEEEKLGGDSSAASATAGPAPHAKPNFLTKFLKPHVYNDYATMRRLIPREIEVRYEQEDEDNAYFNPSVTADAPLLWIPRDDMGISAQEIRDTPQEVRITDEGAAVDGRTNKIVWDREDETSAPIYQEPVYY